MKTTTKLLFACMALPVASFGLVQNPGANNNFAVSSSSVAESKANDLIEEASSLTPDPNLKVQVALLLDNSGSMSGLLEQARQQIWVFVNELAKARKDGKIPTLEIALYEYGNVPTQVLSFTTDLDLVSERLFALTISGGDEHCGQVIHNSVNDLNWSTTKGDLHVIFIAGNEPFSQGNYRWQTAVDEASAKGIVVNTIYCGGTGMVVSTNNLSLNTSVATSSAAAPVPAQPELTGEVLEWKLGADQSRGAFFTIDQNSTNLFQASPFDSEIASLNSQLNATYIGFGSQGEANIARQSAQDWNSTTVASTNLSNRAVAKTNSNYRNDSWDLVDNWVANDNSFKAVKTEELPEFMQTMTPEERENEVKKKLEERNEVKEKIKSLDQKRQEFFASAAKEAGENTLNDAMTRAVREQAQAKGFSFE